MNLRVLTPRTNPNGELCLSANRAAGEFADKLCLKIFIAGISMGLTLLL